MGLGYQLLDFSLHLYVSLHVVSPTQRPQGTELTWLLGLPSKESACNAGDLRSIPGSGRSPGEGNGNPLQYSGLESSTDRGAWQVTVHGVAESWTQLNDQYFQGSEAMSRLQRQMCQKCPVAPGTPKQGGVSPRWGLAHLALGQPSARGSPALPSP